MIAIITALAGVLMPVIEIDSEQDKATRCAKHQDRIAQACNLYGNDNESAVPPSLPTNKGWSNVNPDRIDRSIP